MQEIKLKNSNLAIIFSLGLALILYCSFSVYHNLRGYLFYQAAASMEKPSLKLGREEYYKEVIFLISRAISHDKDNAEYLVKKADYIYEALNEGFGGKLLLGEKDAGELYLKAVSLNPVNFGYHLKLGWFYSGTNNQQAEKELQAAVSLCPLGPQSYFLLARHYLANGDYPAAFGNLIVVLQYTPERWSRIIREIKEQLKGDSPIVFNGKERVLSLTVFPKTYEFEFAQAKFPHVKIPLKIRVYTNEPQAKPTLYRQRFSYANFTKLNGPEENVYELTLEESKGDIYLDTFIIKTLDYSPIEKIEIIKYF